MEQIANNVYVETGYEGVNTGAIITRQGIVAVDVPSYPREARDWAMQLHALTHRPILYVVLTDYHGDRILNARWLNAPLVTHTETAVRLRNYDKRYPNALLESLALRNPQRSRELSNAPVEKTAISFSEDMRIVKGETDVELIAAPGPTLGNIWVSVPQAGVLFCGDTVADNRHPLLQDPCSRQWLISLDRLRNWPESIQSLVPGRGPVITVDAVEPVASCLELMRTRIETHIRQGLSRDESAVYASQIMEMFPQDGLPEEWLHSEIVFGLAQIYDEIQLERNGTRDPLTVTDSSPGITAGDAKPTA